MFIRTQRLLLRPGWLEDLQEVTAGIGEFAVARNLAQVPHPYDEAAGRDWLSRPFDARQPSLLITLPGQHGAPVIGGVGFGPRADHAEFELGYWIARQHWGNGFATEAVRGLVDYARSIGITRLAAGHFLDNPASGRVLEKAGFLATGKIEQQFSLARGEQVPCAKFVLRMEDLLPAAA